MLTVVVAGAVLVFTLVVGGWLYVTSTATPLHPIQQDIPAVTHSAPQAGWNAAVTHAREVARAGLIEQNLPGLSVAVGAGSEIVWAEGFGWANIENRVPVEPNLRFRIGTASTVLTSAAAGLLLEKNQLNLDATIQTYVPEFPEKQWPVTLRQVMAHTAGIRSDGGDEGPLFGEQCERPRDALQHFADSSLRFEPGTEHRISRFGWILVSAAIEAAAEEPFLRFMRKQIFEPLGMDDTVAESVVEPVRDRATSYFPRFAADPRYGPDPMRDLNFSCYAGASVFMSTASDLVRFGMAINGGKLLKPATVELLQASQRLTSGQETGYGLGWDRETTTVSGQPAEVIGHNGDILGGQAASFLTFPKHGIVVAVLSNTSYANTFSIAVRIAQTFAQRGEMR